MYFFEDRFIPSIIVTTVGYVAFQLYTARSNEEFYSFLAYLTVSVLSYFLTEYMIPLIKVLNLKADMFGLDINKKGTAGGELKIPESLGIVPATVYLIFNILGILFTKTFLPSLLLAHVSALLGISFIVFLGFADDVLDLAWRYKMILPPIASLPVIVAYSGLTNVVVPHFFKPYFRNPTVELGPLYYLYMGMLATFQTNAINIYAGVNGLEVGQSLIIACSIAVHNGIEIQNGTIPQQHIFSLLIILPYLFTALALYKHNHFPSKVFVGDVFCYWSGMTFAVAGILGHFSKTLMLFCIPQIINFVYSIPQLFGIIHCPRHRLPKYNNETKLLEPIKTNLTLINLYLLIKGPTSEQNLCRQLLILQIVCSVIGFSCRYLGSQLLF